MVERDSRGYVLGIRGRRSRAPVASGVERVCMEAEGERRGRGEVREYLGSGTGVAGVNSLPLPNTLPPPSTRLDIIFGVCSMNGRTESVG
jgi:hypothetical protein